MTGLETVVIDALGCNVVLFWTMQQCLSLVDRMRGMALVDDHLVYWVGNPSLLGQG